MNYFNYIKTFSFTDNTLINYLKQNKTSIVRKYITSSPSLPCIIFGVIVVLLMIALIVVIYKKKFEKNINIGNNLLIVNSVLYVLTIIGGIVCIVFAR